MGSFELDLRSGELRAHASDSAGKVVLREQTFQVLRMLVEMHGQVVTRGEIQKKLWPNDTIVDFDHSINVTIGELRRAFGDSAANARYIETLARRGYRLIAAVERLEAPVEANIAEATDSAESRPTPLGDLTGRTVSHYRVIEVLGRGGMGLVYEAEDLKLGRHAALKFLPQELTSDPAALRRLEREAQTASALNHPNICTIYEIDEHGGQPFIAMELLEGETLQQRLAATAPAPIPPLPLIDIAIQICVGLEAAHGKDIVHRDIKPANVFLTKSGTVKLLDFGIAKLAATDEIVDERDHGGAGGQRAGQQPGLTRTDATVGTTGYMSPEQMRRQPLDGRSDLYSLGLVLYEMATGRAFTEETPAAVPEPTLARIVARALEKDRTLRYQKAADMRLDLERAHAELVQPAAPRHSRRWLPATAAVALLLIAAAAVWIVSRGASRVTLEPNDTIVLSDVTNATSDHVFDDALYTALRLGLEQTPYLNVLANDKLGEARTSLAIDADARLTPELALEVCRRTGSRVVVATAIAEAGNRLAIELQGIDCGSGSVVSRVEKEVASRDSVIAALGNAAVQLRRELGEPATSIDHYDAPLEKATSSSPDAIELLRTGYRRQLSGDVLGAVPYYQRAAQIDPSFALAHAALSNAYSNMSESALAVEAGTRAFSLRDRMTAPARFQVESTYHREVIGDLEAACAALSEWVAAFTLDGTAHNNLGYCLMARGELDRALGEYREAARLRPTLYSYGSWIFASLTADRNDEAQKTMDDALGRGFDSPFLRDLRVRLAFLRHDDTAMQEQWAWASGRADAYDLIVGKACVEAYRGQFRAALRSADTAAALQVAEGVPPDLAIEIVLWQAEVGLEPKLRIAVTPDQPLRHRSLGALALARTGHVEEARRAADGIREDFPSRTIVQSYGLPLIEGAIALALNDPTRAVTALQPAGQYDLSYSRLVEPLYPAYIRGLAHLRSGDASLAAADFQKMLDHPGLMGRTHLMPLARLQMARAQLAMGADAAALQSYETFLALWRDADADIPVYREAKAEHQKLIDRLGRS